MKKLLYLTAALLLLAAIMTALLSSAHLAEASRPPTNTPAPTHTPRPTQAKGLMHHFLGNGECQEKDGLPDEVDNVEWFLGPCPAPTDTSVPPTATLIPTEVPATATDVPEPTETRVVEPTEAPPTATQCGWWCRIPPTSTPGATQTPQPTEACDPPYCFPLPTGTPKPAPYGLTVHTALDLDNAQFCTPATGTYYIFAFSSPSRSWSEGGLEEWNSHARAKWIANAGDCDSGLISFWLPFGVSNEEHELIEVWFVPADGSVAVKLHLLNAENAWLGAEFNSLEVSW